ncbi:MAG: LLM class flavin-dependent oxidoreductase [Thermoprotei archaeon]
MLEPLFGVSINPLAKNFEDAFRIAQIADESGLDLVGMQDHPYNGSFMDTWTLLSALGAHTHRVHLMVNVANLPLRHPAMLAKAAATLDIITRGRIELGVGAGYFWDGVESFGGPRRKPKEAVEALEESIKIIKIFFNAESDSSTLNFTGKHYTLKNAQAGPKPYHPIRIWVGGYGRRMLKIAGELADGITVSLPFLPPEKLPEAVNMVRESALKSGRNPQTIRVNYNFGGIILEDDAKSQSTPKIDNVIVASVNEWVNTLRRLRALGVDSFSFGPAGADKIGQIKLYAEQVVPKVREILDHQS